MSDKSVWYLRTAPQGKTMKFTNSDIIDAILGHASLDQEGRLQRAVQSDSAVAARYAHWSRILQSTRSCAVREQAMQQDAIDSVMRQVRKMPMATPDRPSLGEFRPRVPWRSAFAAMAACAILVTGYFFAGFPAEKPRSEHTNSTPNQLASNGITAHGTANYFAEVKSATSEEHTTIQSFSTLVDAVDATNADGAIWVREARLEESIRIRKPMRLCALSDAGAS